MMNQNHRPTLEELRSRPHWSFSSINGLLNYCSLAWAFRYVYQEQPQFTPVALVFGSVFHTALTRAFETKRSTGTVDIGSACELFRECLDGGLERPAGPPVKLDGGTDSRSLHDLGVRMINAYLGQLDPEEQVVDTAVPFSLDIGADKPLIGEYDAIVLGDGVETIVDWKTSARRWPAGRAVGDPQPVIYLAARATTSTAMDNIRFRFDVVTKTREPVCEHHYAECRPDDIERLASVVDVLRRQVWAEVFLPSGRNGECGNCPYSSACRSWHHVRGKRIFTPGQT